MADDRTRTARGRVARDVTAVFHDVLLARELHAISVKNLEQKERHRGEAEKRFEAGVATDYDVLAARVGVEDALPPVIRGVNAVREARENLRFLLGAGGGGWTRRGRSTFPCRRPRSARRP
jgi:HAE1 family hydrophobic/amphiphilic exporter-1